MKRPSLFFLSLFVALLLVCSVQGQINLENKKENSDEKPPVENSELAKSSLTSSLAPGLQKRFSVSTLKGFSFSFTDSPKTYQLRFWSDSLQKRVGLGSCWFGKRNTVYGSFYDLNCRKSCNFDEVQVFLKRREVEGNEENAPKIPQIPGAPTTGDPNVLSITFEARKKGKIDLRFWNKSQQKYVGLGRCAFSELKGGIFNFECPNHSEFDEIELHRTFPPSKTCSFLSADYGKTEEGTSGEPQLSVSIEDPRDKKTTSLVLDAGRINFEKFERKKFRIAFPVLQPLRIRSTFRISGSSKNFPRRVQRKALRIKGVLQEVRCVRIDHGFEWTISQKVTHARLHLIGVGEAKAIDIAVFNEKNLVHDIKYADLKKLLEEKKMQSKLEGKFRHFYLNLSCQKKCEFDRVVITLHDPDTYIRGAEFTVATIRKPVDWVKRKSDNL